MTSQLRSMHGGRGGGIPDGVRIEIVCKAASTVPQGLVEAVSTAGILGASFKEEWSSKSQSTA